MLRSRTSKYLSYALILTLVGSVFSIVLPAIPQSFGSHENVTVNIDGDIDYEPDDSVTIVGTIDNVEEDEDVTIRIKDANGSNKPAETVEEDEDDGYFDFVYDIPGTAAEGVWQVEAEYSNDKMYTYFIVDDDADTITVELDQSSGIYEAGDEVTISGQVDNPDSSETEVEITVLDPLNPLDPIVDEEAADLDDDEFEFSFDLDDEASHGRYAVKVTYSGDEEQEGSAIFEIEDDDNGGSSDNSCSGGEDDTDGDLSVELGEDPFAPSDTVCMSGTIDNYDSGDNEELVVVVEDPEGEEVDDYGDDDASVESNGDFEYEFDLDDNAAEGTYSVTLTYAGDEVVVTFEVEDSGTGGSGETGDLTVKLDKTSYLAGNTMAVSGTVADVADPDDEEVVAILLYTPEGKVILAASKYVTPTSNGAYSATILLDSDLDPDKGYEVVVSYLDDQVTKLFDITGVSSAPSDKIVVKTDKGQYSAGATVKISGEVPDALLVEDEQLLVKVNTPDGNPCRLDPIDVPSSGSYTYSLVLGGKCGVSGNYKVEVSYNGDKSTTTFQLIGGSSASAYGLKAGDKTYQIEYELPDGSIKSMFVRPTENKLVISIDTAEPGQLKIVLPREVIDSIKDGEDIDYLVTVEDEAGEINTIEADETENTDAARTLTIDYGPGTGRIEISGTQVVPEFGGIAAIVLGAAIMSLILMSAKYAKNMVNSFKT